VSEEEQLRTNLPQGPSLGVQVGYTLYVHGGTVMTPPPLGRVGGAMKVE
jgi:hypothetical protein